MANLSIKAEVLPGTDLEEAIQEARALSMQLDKPVEIRFNGCPLHIHIFDRVSDKLKEYEQWEEETKKGTQSRGKKRKTGSKKDP